MTITKLLNHPVVILALTIVAITFFLSLNKSGKKTQNSTENIRVLEYEVGQILEEIIDLEEKIEETESEQFKEKVVRNELLMQKPGEYVLQIQEPEEKAGFQTNINNTLESISPTQSWIELIL